MQVGLLVVELYLWVAQRCRPLKGPALVRFEECFNGTCSYACVQVVPRDDCIQR